MGRPVPVHYLRPNETVWSPRHIAVFDTESTLEDQGKATLHRLRLWAATARRRDTDEDHQRPGHRDWGHTGAELADWVEHQLVGIDGMWLYAHNLSYDLTTTNLLGLLARRGWRPSAVGLTDRNPWFRLRRRTKHLTLADSWSWLPTALERIGELTGVRKPALPEWEAGTADWLVRCFGDVDTTMAAMGALMDWWDAEKLGRWSITGASTGWNAMRHMTRRNSFTIDPAPDARAFERAAIRGGRRDVWRTGPMTHGPYVHLDIVRAHASVAELLPLPAKRTGHFTHQEVTDPRWRRPGVGIIARAVVRCDTPHYGVRHAGNVWWPVGEFETVLAGPELELAAELGELVSIGEGWRYRLSRSLYTWAHWANRLAAGETPRAPAVAELAAKSWGRSVVGKFAAHSSESHAEGVALSPTVTLSPAWSLGAGARATILDIGDERWWITHDQDAENAFPAVLAYVEAWVRAAMLRVIDYLGPSMVVACDTDGLIVDLPRAILRHSAGPKRPGHPPSALHLADLLCKKLAPLVAPLTIRADKAWDRIVVDGAQQLTLGGTRHLAGVPSDAAEVAPRVYRTNTWPKLRWQMSKGTTEGYTQPLVTYRPKLNRVRRWVGVGGATWPVGMRRTVDGANEMVPWDTDPRGGGDMALAERQHPVLAKL